MINHHPDHDLLFDYVSGSLPEAFALAIAAHNNLCAACRRVADDLLRVGGALLESGPLADVDEDACARMLSRLNEPETPPEQTQVAYDHETLQLMPAPLLHFLPTSLKDLPWKNVGHMFDEFRLPLRRSDVRASIVRMYSGIPIPKHTHYGHEINVVLSGGFRDGDQQFGPGDFAIKDSNDEHRQVIDQDGPCITFFVLDAPIRFTGPIGRLLNPLLRS